MNTKPFLDYLEYQPREDLEKFSKVTLEQWNRMGEKNALETFHAAASTTPAYKDFLAKNHVDSDKITTISDFSHVPPVTKDNYLRHYPLADLVMGGDLSSATIINASSGSTGKSMYWPKSLAQDIGAYKGAELLFTYYFDIDRVKTLFIDCFALGPWQAGELMAASTKALGEKGRPTSVMLAGINIDVALNIVQDMGTNFDQVVLVGYSSFLKDLAEEGVRRGISWSQYNIKLFTAGEKFSENWRQLMIELLGMNSGYRSIASGYALVEVGITGLSTPFADHLRQYLALHPELQSQFFERSDLPSIAQYIPPLRYAEIIDGIITLTAPGLIPIVRYTTNDGGKILSSQEVLDQLPGDFISSYTALNDPYGIPNLPILTIDGRVDRTITFYALNIYPEQITGILDLPELRRYTTGRFGASNSETRKADPQFTLSLELKPEVKPDQEMKAALARTIADNLADMNSEYRHLREQIGEKALPQLELLRYHDPLLTPISGKGIVVKK